jgi:hypothetical protein
LFAKKDLYENGQRIDFIIAQLEEEDDEEEEKVKIQVLKYFVQLGSF